MKLHDNFFLKLGVHQETKFRIAKNQYGSKNLEEYKDYKYYPLSIIDKNENIVCYAKELNEFLELLGAFVSNQLNPEKVYGFRYKESGGFYGKVVRKDKIHYLKIEVEDNSYYLEKYDCRVIIANAKQILSKCTFQEFLPYFS